MENYPDTTIVASAKAFTIMKQFFGCDYAEHQLVVKRKRHWNGKHHLHLFAAPMVHLAKYYDLRSYAKVFFSADAFGKFGALELRRLGLRSKTLLFRNCWKIRRQVQALLKKAAGLDIQTICPLHGPSTERKSGLYLNLSSVMVCL